MSPVLAVICSGFARKIFHPRDHVFVFTDVENTSIDVIYYTGCPRFKSKQRSVEKSDSGIHSKSCKFLQVRNFLYIYSDQYLNPNLTFEDIRTKKFQFQFQVKMKMLFPKWLFCFEQFYIFNFSRLIIFFYLYDSIFLVENATSWTIMLFIIYFHSKGYFYFAE